MLFSNRVQALKVSICLLVLVITNVRLLCRCLVTTVVTLVLACLAG